MSTLSLKLPDSLAARLANAAHKRGQSKSALIRDALEQYLNTDAPLRPQSALELAQKFGLVGCVEGPGDLSYNKDHMRDFGK